jgi:LacI family transcriptional regulator
MKQSSMPRVLLVSAWQSHDLAAGVARYAVKAGWHLDLSFFICGEWPEDWQGEGILALPTGGRSDLPGIHLERQPVVAMTANCAGMGIPYVDVDNEKVGAMAAEHLLERNFQHFAYYGGLESQVIRLRGEGFAGRLAQAGRTSHQWVWPRSEEVSAHSWDGRQQRLKKALRSLPKPIAVFAVDDLHAVEVIEAGLQLHLRMPTDLAILGAGNHALISRTTAIPLSSVAIDEKEIGYQAALMLDRRMRGEAPDETPLLIPPTGVAIRKSTDTIATEHPDVAKAIRYMLTHYREPIQIPNIVAATSLSQTGLYLAFHAEFNESPARFLTRLRLDRAKQTLADPTQKLSTIALTHGFGDPNNLFRVFKRFEGMSPREYRRKVLRMHPADPAGEGPAQNSGPFQGEPL